MFRSTVLTVLLLVTGASAGSTDKFYTDEPIQLQNYPDSPVVFSDLIVVSKAVVSDEFMEICVDFQVDATPEIESTQLSYEVTDSHRMMLVGVWTPSNSGRMKQCFSNEIAVDEGYFLIRPSFVEERSTGRTLWESEDHKANVKNLFGPLK